MISGYNAVLLSLLEMSLSFSELYLIILFENNSTKKIDASVWAKLNGVVSVLGEDTTCHVLQVFPLKHHFNDFILFTEKIPILNLMIASSIQHSADN
jgi:hypothetical protein